MQILSKNVKKYLQRFWCIVRSKSFISQQLENELKHKKHIKALEEALQKIIQKDAKKSKGKLVVFIDDLDRCNPQYAIKFLEYLKHIFNIPNCIFVLAIDELQLKSSIEVVYGNKNGEDFLAKIIDFKFKLPKPDIQSLIMYFIEKEHWDVFFEVANSWNITPENRRKNFIDVFNTMTKAFKLSARDVFHICQDLNVIFKSHNIEIVSPIYILLVYLIENYAYKIRENMESYLKAHDFNYLEALKHYCSANKLEIQNFNSNRKAYAMPGNGTIAVEFSSSIREYIDFLDYKDNFDYPANQAEKFYAASPYDFDTKQYRDLYPRTKKIIQDIFELSETRQEELELEETAIRERNFKNAYFHGDGLFKAKK